MKRVRKTFKDVGAYTIDLVKVLIVLGIIALGVLIWVLIKG